MRLDMAHSHPPGAPGGWISGGRRRRRLNRRFGGPLHRGHVFANSATPGDGHRPPPGEYVVAAAGSPALVAALTAWLAAEDLPLADLRAGRQRLEDVFLRLVADPVPSPDATSMTRKRRRPR